MCNEKILSDFFGMSSGGGSGVHELRLKLFRGHPASPLFFGP